MFQSQRKAFNSKAHRLEGEAAKLAAEAEKKAKRGGAATGLYCRLVACWCEFMLLSPSSLCSSIWLLDLLLVTLGS